MRKIKTYITVDASEMDILVKRAFSWPKELPIPRIGEFINLGYGFRGKVYQISHSLQEGMYNLTIKVK